MKKRGIKSKLTLYFGIFYSILFAFLTTIVILFSNSLLKTSLKRSRYDFVTLTFKEIAEAFVTTYQVAPLSFYEKILNLMKAGNELSKILIVSPQGRVLFDSDEINSITSSDTLFPVEKLKNFEITALSNSYTEYIVPILSDKGILSRVIVYKFSNSSLKRLSLILGVVAVLAYIFLLQTALHIVSLILKPFTLNIERLKSVAESIESGNYSVRANIVSGDELQYLSDAFNEMLESIEKYIYNLKSMVRELELRDKSREEVLAKVSHEMRTPLTASIGYTELMRNGKLGPLTQEQIQALEIIERNLKKLEQDTRKLIAGSKLALEHPKLDLTHVNLEYLVETILQDFQADLEKKNVKVRTELKVKSLVSDYEQLNYILNNLISNAVKFTPPGGEIEIGSKRASNADEHLKNIIWVFNSGTRIPDEEINKIFEPFYQVSEGPKREHPGMGLGLYIAKKSVEVLKGRISVENQQNGITFYVYLPESYDEEGPHN